MSYSPSYPIGRFEILTTISEAHRHDWIQSIDRLPSLLADLVAHLNEESLEKQYREDNQRREARLASHQTVPPPYGIFRRCSGVDGGDGSGSGKAEGRI